MAKGPYSLTWLPKVLRDAGLKVEEVPGWQYRGRGDMKPPKGVLLHHTAGALKGNMPSLDLLIRGRSDLGGPLAQLGLARDGTYYVIAAGKSNHAGKGHFGGVHGNSDLLGIEAENTGLTKGPRKDPWPDVQMDAYRRGVLAILNYLKLPIKMAIGHKEWAAGRKIDPSFDMVAFRKSLEDMKNGRPGE